MKYLRDVDNFVEGTAGSVDAVVCIDTQRTVVSKPYPQADVA
jgi:hypothetical protein